MAQTQPGMFSSGLSWVVCDTWVVVHADHLRVVDLGHPKHVTRVLGREDVVPDNVPDQPSVGGPVDRCPARDFVGFLRIDRFAVIQPSLGDALAEPLGGRDAVIHPPDTHHISAGLQVRVRIEQVVCDRLEGLHELLARHL